MGMFSHFPAHSLIRLNFDHLYLFQCFCKESLKCIKFKLYNIFQFSRIYFKRSLLIKLCHEVSFTVKTAKTVTPLKCDLPRTATSKHSLQFLCRLQSIAAHRDHFVRHLSVRPSICLVVTLSWKSRIAMFHRRHMHSSECCHCVPIYIPYIYNVVVTCSTWSPAT